MTSIWAIESGAYSDYHIVGVFSTRENAELMAKTIGGDKDIVEWELDPSIDQLRQGLCCYYILMFNDGEVQHCYISMPASEPLPKPQIYTRRLRGQDELMMWVYVWAKDEQGAIKAANEIRTQLIAANQFRETTNET